MTRRYSLPDPEDTQFVQELNQQLNRYDTVASASSVTDERTERTTYMLVFARGSKRHSIMSELPFSWQGTEQVIDLVKPWLEGNVGGDAWFRRWSTDVRFAD